MRYYIKAERRAAIAALLEKPGAELTYEAIKEHNQSLVNIIYSHLEQGGAAYQRTKHHMIIFHTSPRGNGITATYFSRASKYTRWLPEYHIDNMTPKKLYIEMYLGAYVNLLD